MTMLLCQEKNNEQKQNDKKLAILIFSIYTGINVSRPDVYMIDALQLQSHIGVPDFVGLDAEIIQGLFLAGVVEHDHQLRDTLTQTWHKSKRNVGQVIFPCRPLVRDRI